MSPTTEEIKKARKNAGLTQTKAGLVVHAALKTWQHWEYGRYPIPPAAWELFLIKTGQMQIDVKFKKPIGRPPKPRMDKATFEDKVKGMQSREREGAQIDQPAIEEMIKGRPIRKEGATKEKRRLIKKGLKSK